MPTGCCILGIGILGVAIREKSRHVCLLGVAFWGICILGVAIRENPDTYAFWGSHLGICILGVAIRENPDTYAFWGLNFGYLHSGCCDS